MSEKRIPVEEQCTPIGGETHYLPTNLSVPRSDIEAVVLQVMAAVTDDAIEQSRATGTPPLNALRGGIVRVRCSSEHGEPTSTPWHAGGHTLLIAAADGSITLGPQLAEAIVNLVHADRAMQSPRRRTAEEEGAKEDAFREAVRELMEVAQMAADCHSDLSCLCKHRVPLAIAKVLAHLEKP